MFQIVNYLTRKPVEPKNYVFTGFDSPWEVVMDLNQIRSRINLDYFKVAPPGLGKYLPFMPIRKAQHFISLLEKATPLLKSKFLGKKLGIDLYFKLEGKNPTGSFKDRGSSVDISIALELNAKGIILASTGNMAASCACYAAAAKIPCFIIIPEGVPVAKLAQVIAFGGRIVQVKGNYNDAAALAEALAAKLEFYLAGDYAFRVEGQKTAAFELIDQLFFKAPDMVIVPIGCGTNMASYEKGFQEYLALGLIDKIPTLIGVQAEGASAVVKSFEQKEETVKGFTTINTVASAIAIPNPIDGIKALNAIYNTGGLAISVSDDEILEAQYLLASQEGLFVESASAATIAGLFKLKERDNITGNKIACILTGDGLKDASVVLKSAIKPVTIYPSVEEFDALYQNHFFEGNTMIFGDKNRTLLTTSPSLTDIKSEIRKLVNVDYPDNYLQRIKTSLEANLKKGKTITVADILDSIHECIETPHTFSSDHFKVKDFKVITQKDKPAVAEIEVEIANIIYRASSEGVGPVDAMIKALIIAGKEKIEVSMKDYKVEVREDGVDAVVSVELKLAKDNLFSVGRASSPDIIQASLEAFEKAYNGLQIFN